MRKQELVYVHGLLVCLRDCYEARTDESIDTPEYDAMAIRPTSIHRGKGDHEAAVFALSEALAGQIGTRTARVQNVE
jgi:hypothetical protein